MQIYLAPPATSIFQGQILRELVSQLNIARITAHSDINTKARQLTEKLIRAGDFINDLKGSELRGSFGIRPAEYRSRIAQIVGIIRDDTHIFSYPLRLTGSSISGGWVLAMGTNLFEKLKNSPAGITTTEKGANVPWLKWTLEVGNAVIISDFRVKFTTAGRSGFAVMVPNTTIGYRVPPRFTGTDYDNWITRNIIPYLDKYSELILKTLNRYAP